MVKIEKNLEFYKYIDKNFLIKEGFKWALINSYSDVKLGELEKLNIDAEQLIEARVFSETKEIHIFKNDDFKVVKIEDGESEFIESEFYLLSNRFENNPKKLKVKKYVDYDEDGQGYISYIRPCNIVY